MTLALVTAPAVPPPAPGAPSDQAVLGELRRDDLRVAAIGYRLATRGVALCQRRQAQTGLLIHDLQAYGPGLRDSARALFRFGDTPSIEAVVPGSPADLAGVRADDRLLAINGRPLAASPASGKADLASTIAATVAVQAAAAAGPVTLAIERAGERRTVTMAPVPGCLSRFEVAPGGGHNASADGQLVQVSTAVLADADSDDELAFLIGHEMSHNILGHRVKLEDQHVGHGMLAGLGRNGAVLRRTEEEADYLSLFLMDRAGYAPAAAARFWQRFAKAHGWGILSDATHLNDAARVRFLTLEADQIAAAHAAGRTLDPDLADVPGLAARAKERG